MAIVRILDLAKDLGADVADVMSAARDCGIMASGPTSMLTAEDREKLSRAVKTAGNKPAGGKPGARTLTLNKPLVAGQTRTGAKTETGGRRVQVEVRRTTRRVVTPPTPTPTSTTEATPPASAPVAKSRLTPAQTAAKAVADKRESAAQASAAAAAAATKTPVAPATPAAASTPTAPATPAAASTPVAATTPVAASAPAASTSPAATRTTAPTRSNAPLGRTQTAGRAPTTARTPATGRTGMAGGPASRDNQSRGRQPSTGQAANRSGGPRTTIRRGLTPAQIAAAKAPSSSLKDIEDKIRKERSEQRAQRASSARPDRQGSASSSSPAGSRQPSRAPSVAVAPDASAGGPQGAQRRRTPGGAGGPQNFQRRRLSPAEKAARRAYADKRHVVMTDEQEDRMARLARGDRRRRGVTKDDEDFVKREVEIPETLAVSELASRMAIKGADVVRRLFEMGVAATVNESIDAETAQLIVEEFGHVPKMVNASSVENVFIDEAEEDDELSQPRPPVVVVMGHVDHGKTSILDALRKAHVADGEAGGITQHIGAYMVKLETGHRVVFIDTPGHEAFTGLRARGAKLTDVAVLVVAADDGVMPQTVEALNHARAANVPIIVAVNKMDKEGADPEKVMRQLAEHELVSEEWGGNTIFVKCSAHTGEGLDDLLEMLALQTEILELKANPTLRGRGLVIESRLDKGRGPSATVLVQNGTFNKGDIVVVGTVTGRIRAIVDENGKQHRTAGPSIPFELLGLESVPEAGQEIVVVENDRQAREIISYREDQHRKIGMQQHKNVSMEDLFASAQGEGAKEVNVLIKGDVTGSVEAMADSLAKAGTDEVQVKIVHRAIGGITESDVMLASASNAIIIGFNVRPETKAKKLAEAEGVDVRFYKVIYEAIDEMKMAMAGVLAPEQREKVIGSAEVREVFQVPKAGAVAGSFVTDGIVTRGASARVLRDGVLIYDGKLASLRRFKDDVKEVKNGYECGIGIDKFNDIKPGDVFEFYVIEEFAATL
ncbi:MAG: translation initiation factor IF-2 [Zetaproteobacteria bacterium CG12_big_fil_rev_8_21_14_0_65_55_1124]|nr:MAG: translation initiation factor IF-2 [Zetaproteobacteria bacterium CG1_02_55_237]PIS19176.1 MAG: translation initiation factor IF-2 [Zetaproteobacteria bacterium CG08_land_8_20_14_0_20_55_17]PIW43871.1 MAG: translation initiation factor IF-2 [Zetaproteobacteria bacterium CG12_big_fil_rev_8_21_14_0_65_55_1124]PIY53017.1 MAG: translation initiation factor IF-2 [Zetaproteobacteria bacterium CG_4_10_14_0_8_um_filter_55_43]PIZ37651.1 MAG: translation initiation factor IF-2 [Zetaproteobacteria 